MQHILRATALVLLFVTAFFYPLLAPAPHRIDQAHFELIADGMTEANVEAIFGVPAGSYDWARPKMEAIYLLALARAQLQLQPSAPRFGSATTPKYDWRMKIEHSSRGCRSAAQVFALVVVHR